MKIGRVDLPAVTKIERKPLSGNVDEITIEGVLIKNSSYTDSLDVQFENLKSLKANDLTEPKLIRAAGLKHPVIVDEKAAYNFIDYAGLKGFLAVKEVSAPKSAEQINLREVSISGIFAPASIYKRNLRLGITDLQNDWGITGRTLVALPPNSTNIEGATELYSVDTEDGTVKIYEASGDEVAFDCELSDEELGAVTVWDTNSTTAPTETDLANKSSGGTPWTKVLNKEHVFGSNWVVVENGYIAIAFKKQTDYALVFYYNGSWKGYYPFVFRSAAWCYIKEAKITEISPDIVKFVLYFIGSDLNPDEYETIEMSIFRGKNILHVEVLDRNPANAFSTGITRSASYFVADEYVRDRKLFTVQANSGSHQYALQFSSTGSNIVMIYNTGNENINVSDVLRLYNPATKHYGFALIPFDCSKLFAEAEDGIISGDTANVFVDADADASNGQAVKFQPVTAYTYSIITDVILPKGTYRVFYRMKVDDTTDTAKCLQIYVKNIDAGTIDQVLDIHGSDFASANTYEYKYFDFEHDGISNMSIRASRSNVYTATANVWIDYILIVPLTNGKNFPQDIAHDAMRLVEPRRELKLR